MGKGKAGRGGNWNWNGSDTALWVKVVCVLAVGVFAVCAIGLSVTRLHEDSAQGCLVKDKDLRIVALSEDDRAPRVYTSCGTFEVADVVPVFFEAGTIYGEVPIGGTCDFKTLGVRLPVLSMFPAITEVSCA